MAKAGAVKKMLKLSQNLVEPEQRIHILDGLFYLITRCALLEEVNKNVHRLDEQALSTLLDSYNENVSV
jgi:hypothetical protein